MEFELIPWKFLGARIALQRNLTTFILVRFNSLCSDLASAVFASAGYLSCRISESYVRNVAHWTSGCWLIDLSLLAQTANWMSAIGDQVASYNQVVTENSKEGQYVLALTPGVGVIWFLEGELKHPAKNSKGNEFRSIPSQAGREKNKKIALAHVFCSPQQSIAEIRDHQQSTPFNSVN